MDYQSLISKSVLSRDNVLLGEISDITPGATGVFITINYSFKRKTGKYTLSLRSYSLLKNIENQVVLNITQDDFMRLINNQRLEQKRKAKAAKFSEVSKNDEAMARSLVGRW